MIRSKPSTAEYRDAWERVFGEPKEPETTDAVEVRLLATLGGDPVPSSWHPSGAAEKIKAD